MQIVFMHVVSLNNEIDAWIHCNQTNEYIMDCKNLSVKVCQNDKKKIFLFTWIFLTFCGKS